MEVKTIIEYKDLVLNKKVSRGANLINTYKKNKKELTNERIDALLEGNQSSKNKPIVEVKIDDMDEVGGTNGGVTPTGTIEINENGMHNVANFEYAEVNVESSGGGTYAPYHISFYGCQAEDLEYELANLDTSYLTYCGYMFAEMPMLMKLDLSNFDVSGKMIDFMFLNSYMLETVILNGSWLDVGDGNFFDESQLARHIFEGTPIAEGNGYIYVPDELVNSFKEHELFSDYADNIRPKSEM